MNLFKSGLLTVVVLLIGLLTFRQIGWGTVNFSQPSTITVTGEAEMQQSNELASFSAGVTVTNQDKQTALNEVNTKVKQIIDAVKVFGIEDKDIQTQSVSVYEYEKPKEMMMESMMRDPETLPIEPAEVQQDNIEWRASNTIEITLRDIDRASILTDLLTRSGATNVYGPNFRLDDSIKLDSELMNDAVANARVKAEAVAQSQKRSLGKIVTINESGTSSPVMMRSFAMAEDAAISGAPLEPGSSTVYKRVVVTFELR